MMTEDRTLNDLINDLSHTEPMIRARARKQIASHGSAALDVLADAIYVRGGLEARGAVEVLGFINDPRALAILKDALHSRNAIIGQAAVEALMRFDREIEVTQFLAALMNANILVQLSIIRALARLKNQGAVRPLIQLLKETPSSTVRYSVLEALGELCDRCTIPTIQQYIDSDDFLIRKHARLALRRILLANRG